MHTTSSRTRVLAGPVAALLVMASAVVLSPVPGAAAAPLNPCVNPDNGRPVVEEVTVTPTTVDVTDGPQQVTVEARVTDSGGPGPASGVARAGVALGDWVELHHVDGDLWAGTLTVPPGAPAGVRTVRDVYAFDEAGNPDRDEEDEEPQDLSRFDGVALEVVSVPDDTPPEALSLTLSRAVVDTSRRAKPVGVVVEASDVGTGIARGRVLARGADRHVSADLQVVGGRLVGELRIPRWSRGSWDVESLELWDATGNRTRYWTREIDALGERAFRVEGGRDRVAPTLLSAGVDPHFLDVREQSGTLHVRARVSDRKSGVKSVTASLLNTRIDLRRVRGTARKGLWTGRAKITPCHAFSRRNPPWVFISMTDRVGNDEGSPDDIRLRVKANDNTPTRFDVESDPMMPEGPLVLTFMGPVNGLTPNAVSIRRNNWPEARGPEESGTWACFRGDGRGTSCLTGKVSRAEWTPDVPLDSGAFYHLRVNPDGNLDLTDLAGNPFRRHNRSWDVRVG